MASKRIELNRERFLRNAEKRVDKALRALDLVENLGNRKAYVYTEDEKEQLLNVLRQKLWAIDEAFSEAPPKEKRARFEFATGAMEPDVIIPDEAGMLDLDKAPFGEEKVGGTD